MSEQHVLFVCTGNICRSPMAQGLLEHYLRRYGLHDRVTVDSAATHGYQAGAPPAAPAQSALGARGISIRHLRARRIGEPDFFRADIIAAMDRHNLLALQAMAPPGQVHKIRLLLEFAGETGGEIADPYGAGPGVYEATLERIDRGALGLLQELRRRLEGISAGGR